jgi:ribosomal protein S18 acetylase RimI-like enzyme
MVRAFEQDPALRWFFPSEKNYRDKAPRFFNIHIKQKIRRGTVFTENGLRGSALWDPPGGMGKSGFEKWEFNFYLRLVHGPDFKRTMEGRRMFEKVRPEIPHWYLSILGVEPAFQGKGIGKALLQPVLDICEKEKIPAFLETAHENSLLFYLGLGFIKTGEFKLPNGPTLITLLKKPA